MKFKKFVTISDKINNESGSKKKRKYIQKAFKESDSESLEIIPRFFQGQIFAKYDSRKTHVSTSLMRSAISEATDISEKELKSVIKNVSDMGELFDKYDINSNSGQQRLGSTYLTVKEIFDVLSLVSETSGSGSQQTKINYIVSLLLKCSSIEAKYLTRLILGNMSIGVGSGTIRKAISETYDIPENKIERALMLTNDAGHVAKVANEKGLKGIENITLSVCEIPLLSMKAEKSTPLEAMNEINTDYVYGEYKYDGFRIQAHKKGDEVKLYTRNLQDVTSSLPDVVNIIKNKVNIDTVVLDGEVVGYKSKSYDIPETYQNTQKRIRRKYGIQEMMNEIPVKPHFFDVLYHGDLGIQIDEDFEERRKLLKSICDSKILSKCVKCENVNDIQELMTQSKEDGHEGSMIKNPYSNYEPNSRGKKWLKLKPEGETIDAIIIGGKYGDGRNSEYISSLELGIWQDDEIVHVGDVGIGLTDSMLQTLTPKLEKEILEQNGKNVKINPREVIEVRFEEVQPSTEYTSGYGLRFPRFVDLRDTKDVGDADSVERLEKIAESL